MTARRSIGLLGCLILAGCSAQASTTANRIDGRRLTIYLSVPLQGASRVQGTAVLNGARLALRAVDGRIGRYRIGLDVRDDATALSGEWNAGQTELNARQAIADRTTVGYIGDLDSGASAISIPLLNRYDIAQVSPTSGAVGLTSAVAGANAGEPQKYYPTGVRTFARVAPSDAIEAVVQARLQRDDGCRRVFVLNDDEVDGFDAAQSFGVAAQAVGLDVVASQLYDPTALSYLSLAHSVAASGADCILISAITENHAVALTEALAAALPDARIFGTAGLAETTFTNPALGGIPLALDRRVTLTSPALAAADYPPAGRSFLSRYAEQFGAPEPDAIFGYEATALLLSAIRRATDGGRHDAVRSQIARAVLTTRDRAGAVGTYSIQDDGNTTLRRYGVYRVLCGQLRFVTAELG